MSKATYPHRRIAIFGSYNGRSIGDTAILLGLLNSLNRCQPEGFEARVLTIEPLGLEQELKALGMSGLAAEFCCGRVLRAETRFATIANRIRNLARRATGSPAINLTQVREALEGVDALIIGGGNLLMDLYPEWPSLLLRIVRVAESCRIPYYFLGVGAGPIQYPGSVEPLLACLRNASGVAVRDAASRALLVDTLGFERTVVGPDLALGLEWCRQSAPEESTLFLNLAAVYTPSWPYSDAQKATRYIDQYVRLTEQIILREGVRRIRVFNTNVPLDEIATSQFILRWASRGNETAVDLIPGKQTVASLLQQLSAGKLAVVTRLHAGILAGTAGCAVRAIAYQPKVQHVLNQVCQAETVISMEQFLENAQSLIEKPAGPVGVSLPSFHLAHKDVDELLLRFGLTH